jgi:hypothetical protein
MKMEHEHLEGRLQEINRVLGLPDSPYAGTVEGMTIFRDGVLVLRRPMEGWKLVRLTPEGKGTTLAGPFRTAPELDAFLRGVLAGIQLGFIHKKG